MKVLELPDSHAEQVSWLEKAIMGSDGNRVIAELSAVFGDASFDLSDEEKKAVYDRGLGGLLPDRFKKLLQAPSALATLQRDVIEFGGDYWNTIDRHDLQSAIIERARPTSSPQLKKTTHDASRPSPSWASNVAWAALGSLATAAALLIIFSEKTNPPNQPVAVIVNPGDKIESIGDSDAWGFAKFARSDIVTSTNVQRANYFDKIATAAEAWSKQRPETPAALAKRLGEFRMGCSALLLADHPLPPEDQQWLKQRCGQWASAIENHLAELENGMSVQEVTARVDVTVTKIAAAIKGRAATS